MSNHDREKALDAIRWYVRCLRDVISQVPVRGLDEAEHGYEQAMAALAAPVVRDADDERDLGPFRPLLRPLLLGTQRDER